MIYQTLFIEITPVKVVLTSLLFRDFYSEEKFNLHYFRVLKLHFTLKYAACEVDEENCHKSIM